MILYQKISKNSNTCLIYSLRNRVISDNGFWQAAQCATAKISSLQVIIKPFTLLTIKLMFYFWKCLGKQYVPWICTQLVQKNKRSADSNHAMYHLLSIVRLPVMCRWPFSRPFLLVGVSFFNFIYYKINLKFCYKSCWSTASNTDIAILIWIHILICRHLNMNSPFNLLQNMLKNL